MGPKKAKSKRTALYLTYEEMPSFGQITKYG